jgi:tetratricopeptide (TPR) repeat protein
VHRDVKPENILLESGHAVVADFGIARAISAAGGEALTQTGIAVGTPPYMSPEQGAGSTELDGRSDLYSLGCVLYEMLSGETPYLGNSPQAILAKKLREPVPRVSVMRETVPAPVEAALARALARVPADRFATAVQFAEALQSSTIHRRSFVRSLAAGAVRRWRWTASIGVLLALSVWGGSRVLEGGGAAGLDPRRVFLAPFENQTGDPSLDHVGAVSVDWLIRELQSTELVQVIDAGALAGTDRASRLGRDAALARAARAGTLVSVAYYRVADSVVFRVRVTETATGARLYTSDPISAPMVTPLDGLDELSQTLVGGVVTLVAPGVEWHANAQRPPSLMAYKEFMAGMALLPRLDFDGAIQHWFRAARIDTTFVTPLLSAASFMLVSGQNARADSLVSSVRARREWLQVSQRHRLDNLTARLRGNIPEALAALRPLAQAAPVSEAAWEYALHELWLNRSREAIAAFGQLDPAWELLRGWWFYWVFYCNAYHVRGDFSTELAVARRGRAQYPNSIRVAEPELGALAALGRIDDLNSVLDEAASMPEEEPAGLARAVLIAAQELRAHGHPEASSVLVLRAWDLSERWTASDHAPAPSLVPAMTLRAMTSYLSGRLEEARERYLELASRDSTDVNIQGHLGVIAARKGDRREALRISGWIEGLHRPYLYGYDTLWRARIAALLGENERAMALLRAAFGQGLKFVGTFTSDGPARTFGPWLHRDIDFESLRHTSAWQGMMRGSR